MIDLLFSLRKSKIGLINYLFFSVMMSNMFGVPNSATLFIYDNKKKYQYVSNTCSRNPAYGSYCFDPSVNVDGDYVSIVVHGYMVKFQNDVSFSVHFNPLNISS